MNFFREYIDSQVSREHRTKNKFLIIPNLRLTKIKLSLTHHIGRKLGMKVH
jgi:hypothetical protein